MYNGVINVYKPKGFTSHDVVSKIRRIAGMKKVGHTGTLDPLAEGVLPICLGKATRISEYLISADKEYLAEITFGQQTDTMDAEGEVVSECVLPDLTSGDFSLLLQSFTGESKQVPPIYSAIKKDGKPLYKYARSGIAVDVPERLIFISQISLLSYNQNKARFLVACSKGTYIRSLAADIARKAGSCGYLSFLQRTKSGRYELEKTVTLDQLETEGVEQHLFTIDQSLPDFLRISLNEEESKKASLGNAVIRPEFSEMQHEQVKIVNDKGLVIAIGRIAGGSLQPKKVFV